MTKIVFFDSSSQDKTQFKKLLKSNKNVSLEFYKEALSKNNIELAKDADILSVFITSDVNSSVLEQLPKLKMIALRATGFDNIDIDYCHHKSIRVCNVPSYGENTVAEYAFLLILALTRKFSPTIEMIKTGKIQHSKLTGVDLKNKTLGVIGTGRIGSHVIRIAKGFEMNVIAYDPYPNEDLVKDYCVEYESLDNLLKSADIISLHVPGTEENIHLLNAKNLKLVKKDAIIINTARGDLIDTKALTDRLVSGQVAGAGLDVVESENLLDIDDEISLISSNDKKQLNLMVDIAILEKLPNVILSAHNAFNSEQAIERIRQTTFTNITSLLSGKIANQVFLPAKS